MCPCLHLTLLALHIHQGECNYYQGHPFQVFRLWRTLWWHQAISKANVLESTTQNTTSPAQPAKWLICNANCPWYSCRGEWTYILSSILLVSVLSCNFICWQDLAWGSELPLRKAARLGVGKRHTMKVKASGVLPSMFFKHDRHVIHRCRSTSSGVLTNRMPWGPYLFPCPWAAFQTATGERSSNRTGINP